MLHIRLISPPVHTDAVRELLLTEPGATYSFEGDAEEIIGKARTGILPIFQELPGFIAYGVMVRGSQLISMSA